MLKFVILVITIVLISAERRSYDNFKVFRILPKTREHLEVLRTLEYHSDEFSFWKESNYVNTTTDIMVAPGKLDEFTKLMNDMNIKYEVYIENVQTLIDNESSFNDRDLTSFNAVFNWTNYHNLDKIYAWLDNLVKDYPDNVEAIVAGISYEGRDIKGIKVSFAKGNPGIFIEGGIHAREWISPATVTYIVNEILTSQDPKVRSIVESYDWYIVPVFNPDGYYYTHTTDRLWRKTRTYYTNQCRGADANRNWDYLWMNGGSSNNFCSGTFAGSSAFSEIETRTLSQYISSIADKFIIYIAFHSYGQHVLFPYGHTTEHLDNYDELYNISTKAIDAISRRYGTKYDIGNVVEILYVATGSSMDWVKGNLKTPIVYTIELRDQGRYGFVLPAKMISPVGEEIVDGLKVILEETIQFGYGRN